MAAMVGQPPPQQPAAAQIQYFLVSKSLPTPPAGVEELAQEWAKPVAMVALQT
jgi:hypothetical protein